MLNAFPFELSIHQRNPNKAVSTKI